jgi:hypothetical protein
MPIPVLYSPPSLPPGIPPPQPPLPSLPPGILTAIHDELTCMVRNLIPAASSNAKQQPQGAATRALSELVSASWRGLMSTLQLLALNQAGFRPLTAEVSVGLAGGGLYPEP